MPVGASHKWRFSRFRTIPGRKNVMYTIVRWEDLKEYLGFAFDSLCYKNQTKYSCVLPFKVFIFGYFFNVVSGDLIMDPYLHIEQ